MYSCSSDHLWHPDLPRNPAGLAIISTYKYGSIGMGLEAYRYGACTVHFKDIHKHK